MKVLETTTLTRNFGKLTAVDALNLIVEQGEVFGLSRKTRLFAH